MSARLKLAALPFAVALLTLCFVGTSHAQSTQVYLLRGFMDVFSQGLDGLAVKIQQRGMRASAHSHTAWQQLADEAVAAYKAGRVRSIIIIGHSLGAQDGIAMANQIGEAGVPVRLVITLDGFGGAAGRNVQRVVNLHVGDGAVERGAGSRASVQNFDLNNRPGIDHWTIHDADEVHRRILNLLGGGSGKKASRRAAAARLQ